MVALNPIVKWFDLGLHLGLSHATLEKIEIERRDQQVIECKREMLVAWLQSDTNTTKQELTSALSKIPQCIKFSQDAYETSDLELYDRLKAEILEQQEKDEKMIDDESMQTKLETVQRQVLLLEEKLQTKLRDTDELQLKGMESALQVIHIPWFKINF